MTMLENAARALQIEAAKDENDILLTVGESLVLARAVLMAAREPDDAMIEEGGKLALSWRDIDGVPGCKKIFTAMVDAILNERDEGQET